MSDDPALPRPAAAASTPLRLWLQAYRVEVGLFVGAFLVLAAFSGGGLSSTRAPDSRSLTVQLAHALGGERFWRQSAAPHFVYQAKAFLEGRLDIDAEVLPNYEDWACVREAGGEPQRCEGQPRPGDRWYSSFPWFPSVVMAPFVALHGYQFNDTSFGVLVGALAVALFFALLRLVREHEGTGGAPGDDAVTALLLGFGTLFFYAAIRGEVWFSAEVMGVAFTALYLRNAVGARRPVLAGLFWSMAVLTRTPLLFTGLFFLLEAVAPTRGARLGEWRAFLTAPRAKLRRLGLFVAGAAPLGLAAAALNLARFGRVTEFGHRFFFNNRVNRDIDTWGLFHPHYLPRNLDAAFLKLPTLTTSPASLGFDFWGLSLFLTLPVLALCFTPARRPQRAWQLAGAMAGVLVASALLRPLAPAPGEPPVGARPLALWLVLALVLAFFAWSAWQWATAKDAPRLLVPTLLTLLACMLPGLAYQNTGYAQFGFRFSLDYTPYLLLLVPLGGWRWRQPLPLLLAAVAVLVNTWGAVAFRGYTEQVRGWF